MHRTKFILAVTTAIVTFSILMLAGCGGPAAGGPPAMPPPAVEIAPVQQEDVPIRGEWVATIDGSVNAQIQPQVMGYLVRQTYQEGAFVRKGQALFEIDARPFQALVDQAKAQVAQAESQVVQAESMVLQSESQVAQASAQLRKAELDVKRDTPLVQAKAISQAQLDTEIQAKLGAEAAVKASQANLATSRAAVTTSRAAVNAAKAGLAQAELNLGFTEVRSLIDGIAGVAQTQIGNLVKNETVLTTVSMMDPMRVYFPISEQEYLVLASKTKPGESGNLLNNPRSLSLELVLANGATYPHKGQVSFADRQVDSQTGTIRIAASFPNPGNLLRPGQFGRIRALIGEQKGALLVPQRAVTELQGKHQVAVVGAGNKVQIRVVQLGPTVDSRYVIASGLRAGEQVIVEGSAKAMDGSIVAPTAAQKAPTAAGSH
jgi:membrane fusion protein (multidrug efflux system)